LTRITFSVPPVLAENQMLISWRAQRSGAEEDRVCVVLCQYYWDVMATCDWQSLATASFHHEPNAFSVRPLTRPL
jgi:hypothetical protein